MIVNQDLVCEKGDSFSFEIDMADGTDLTGASGAWVLAESWFDGAKILLTKPVTISFDQVWKASVQLNPNETGAIPVGTFFHDCKIKLVDGTTGHISSGSFVLDARTDPQSLECERGDSFIFEIDMPASVDLTNAVGTWVLAESWFDSARVFLTKTNGSGLFVDGGSKKIVVQINPADTIAISSGKLFYWCELILNDGSVSRIASGPFNLIASVDVAVQPTVSAHATQTLDALGQLLSGTSPRAIVVSKPLDALQQSATVEDAITPAFSTNFTGISSLPSWLSFSRASHAMVTDSTGARTYAPNNLVLNSTVPDANGSAAVVTGGFSDPDGGTNGRQITFTGANQEYYWYAQVFGRTLSSIWVKGTSGETVVLWADNTGGTLFTFNGSWQQIYLLGTNSDGDRYVDIATTTGATARVFQFYKPVLARVTYETTPRIQDQVLTTGSAYYGPRFDYSYNGSVWVQKGLLDEGQRTNLLKDSGSLTTANWTAVHCAASTSSTTGADNSNFMTLITANNSNDIKEIYNTANVAITSGANHALSVDVKKTNWNYLFFAFQSDTAGHWVCIVVDLSTNTVTQTGVGANSGTLVGTPTVTPLRNGIVRVEFIAAQNTTTGYLTSGFAGAATGNVFASGDGSITTTMAGTETFLVDAEQLSPGSSPTSYIPTGPAAVTRSADILSLAGAADTAAKAASGTIFVEVGELPTTISENANILGSTNNFPMFREVGNSNLASLWNYHSTGITLRFPGTIDWTQINRLGVSHDAGSVSVVRNGGTVANDTGTGDWASDGTIYVGIDAFGAEAMNGHLRVIAIDNIRRSDAYLQAKSVVGAAF
jgi:hypothetical protein